MRRQLLLLLVFGACGGSGMAADDVPGDDAPPVPATITVTGTAETISASGGTAEAGVLVEAFANSDENTVITSGMTDANGDYTLTITTDGAALDGFLKATKNGRMVTYLYPPEPLADNFDGASVKMISESTFNLLDGFCSGNQDAAKGTIAMLVYDAADMPVAGAAVSSSPAATKVCYNSGNFPSGSATATDVDGIGYLFNVTGTATVSATLSGTTFRSHAVNARVGALTTTLIRP